jgi:NAD+ kinase
MAIKQHRILLLCKRSSLSLSRRHAPVLKNMPRFKDNHLANRQSQAAVEKVLRNRNIPFDKKHRPDTIDYSRYSIVITVGGDGTFLQAARQAGGKHLLLGVNSDPDWSVGQFCRANARNFHHFLERILAGNAEIKKLYKLALRLTAAGRRLDIECLNDILVCHANPAGMSRYAITINGHSEEHRSSGIWISSAAGSTGAMLSAGGKILPLESRDIQYRPRELYHTRHEKYSLTGGVLASPASILVRSHMPHGKIFVDGSHVKFPFTYNSTALISASSRFVQLVHA